MDKISRILRSAQDHSYIIAEFSKIKCSIMAHILFPFSNHSHQLCLDQAVQLRRLQLSTDPADLDPLRHQEHPEIT